MRPSRFYLLAVLPALVLALASLVEGCGPADRPAAGAATRAPDPRSDSTAAAKLSIAAPPAPQPPRAPGASVTERAPAPPALPAPTPAPVPDASPSPQAATLEEKFQPPVLRQAGRLETPPGRTHGQIELELRVNQDGLVDQFRFVAGDEDTLLLRAVLDNVRVMRFDPALRGGKPVPAWCRRTFTFGGR
jgi:hypothetical protein